jgi:hypothetical protein
MVDEFSIQRILTSSLDGLARDSSRVIRALFLIIPPVCTQPYQNSPRPIRLLFSAPILSYCVGLAADARGPFSDMHHSEGSDRSHETSDKDVEDDEDPPPAKRRKLRSAPAHEGKRPLIYGGGGREVGGFKREEGLVVGRHSTFLSREKRRVSTGALFYKVEGEKHLRHEKGGTRHSRS